MSEEFGDFAADLERQHKARVQSQDDAAKKSRADHTHRFEVARLFLEANVTPIFERARHAFERDGIRVQVSNNLGPDKYAQWPTLTFQVFGMKRRDYDTTTYEVAGDVVSATHDHEAFKVAISPPNYNPYPGKTVVGNDLAAVPEALKRALSNLYRDISPPGA